MKNVIENMNRTIHFGEPSSEIYKAVTFDNMFVKKIENIDFYENPIIRFKLSNKILRKIKKLYIYVETVLRYNFNIKSLEEFETIFMRENDIKTAVKKWDIITKIFKEYTDAEYDKIKGEKIDIEKLDLGIEDLNIGDIENGLVWVKLHPYIFFISYLVVHNFEFSPEEKNDDIISNIINLYEKLKNN